MKSPIISQANSLSNSIRYSGVQAWQDITSAETGARQTIAVATTLRNFRVELTTAPGVGKSRIFTVVKNGTDSLLVVTVADTATYAELTSYDLSLVAGDTISVKSDISGSPSSTSALYSFEAEQVSGQSVLSGNISTMSQTVAEYYPFQNGQKSTTAPTVGGIIPTPGTISSLQFAVSGTGPGTSKGYVVTLVKNGVDTTLSVSLSGTTTLATDSAHPVSVVQGDEVYYRVDPFGSSPNLRSPSFTTIFTPTTDGESLQTYTSNTNIGNASTIYQNPGGMGAGSTTENMKSGLIGNAVVKKLALKASVAPGSGKSYAFNVRNAGADGSVAATIANSATSAVDNTNSFTTTPGAEISVKSVPSGTPANSVIGWGFVTYIAPPSLANGNFLMFM